MASREELRRQFAQIFPLREAAFGDANSHVFFSRQTHDADGGVGTLIVVDDKTGQVCPANYFGGRDANNRPFNLEQGTYPPNRDSYIYLGTEAQWRVDAGLSIQAIDNNFRDMKECVAPGVNNSTPKDTIPAESSYRPRPFPSGP